MESPVREVSFYNNGKEFTVPIPQDMGRIEVVHMDGSEIAFTKLGVYEIRPEGLGNRILDVEFCSGDAFSTWELEIRFDAAGKKDEWEEYRCPQKPTPEFLMPLSFYDAFNALVNKYPEKKETCLNVLLALFAERKFYADWNREDCWRRARAFYHLDQAMEVKA